LQEKLEKHAWIPLYSLANVPPVGTNVIHDERQDGTHQKRRPLPTTELGNDYGEKLRNSFEECKLNFWQFARLPVRQLKLANRRTG
jgi:hypothetical protein